MRTKKLISFLAASLMMLNSLSFTATAEYSISSEQAKINVFADEQQPAAATTSTTSASTTTTTSTTKAPETSTTTTSAVTMTTTSTTKAPESSTTTTSAATTTTSTTKAPESSTTTTSAATTTTSTIKAPESSTTTTSAATTTTSTTKAPETSTTTTSAATTTAIASTSVTSVSSTVSSVSESSSSTTSSVTSALITTSTRITTLYNVKFYAFDGETVIGEQNVSPDTAIDYSAVDTSPLHTHIDVYTEQAFSSWDKQPMYATSDLKIYALSKTASLSWSKLPDKKVYYSKKSKISLKGFDACVVIETQLPEKLENGAYKVKVEKYDIELSCFTIPETAEEAFAMGTSTSIISIFSYGQPLKEICSFKIENKFGMGDVDSNGIVDARDATTVLRASTLAATKDYVMPENIKKYGDINEDGIVDARDATLLLRYSTLCSSKNNYNLDIFIDENNFIKSGK